MGLKKLPKEMSYEAVRYKHPPTPNHAPAPAPVEDTNAEQTVGLSNPPPKDRGIVPVDDPNLVVDTPVEPRQEFALTNLPQRDCEPMSPPAAGQNAAAGKRVRVRGYVHVPAVGEHRDFDELREIYGEKEALALALSSGMASYEKALREANSIERLTRPNLRSKRIEASRAMAHDLYSKAVEHLDPKGMLGRSQIGCRILEVALAHFGKR